VGRHILYAYANTASGDDPERRVWASSLVVGPTAAFVFTVEQ